MSITSDDSLFAARNGVRKRIFREECVPYIELVNITIIIIDEQTNSLDRPKTTKREHTPARGSIHNRYFRLYLKIIVTFL